MGGGLPDDKKLSDIYNRLDSNRHVTDWQTSCHGIVRTMHMCRTVKTAQ